MFKTNNSIISWDTRGYKVSCLFMVSLYSAQCFRGKYDTLMHVGKNIRLKILEQVWVIIRRLYNSK